MAWSFWHPWALLGLALVLVPLWLHRRRKKPSKIIQMATMHWLPQVKVAPKHWLIQDWWLMLLRMLLLALLVLWLAQPLFSVRGQNITWRFVHPAAASGINMQTGHWLAAGFPPLTQEVPNADDVPLSSLLRELVQRAPSDETVSLVLPTHASGVDAALVSLPKHFDVRWVTVPVAEHASDEVLTHTQVQQADIKQSVMEAVRFTNDVPAPTMQPPPTHQDGLTGERTDVTKHLLWWLLVGMLLERLLAWWTDRSRVRAS